MSKISKIRLALASLATVVVIPATAFAAHAASCCPSFACCLRHLGCC